MFSTVGVLFIYGKKPGFMRPRDLGLLLCRLTGLFKERLSGYRRRGSLP